MRRSLPLVLFTSVLWVAGCATFTELPEPPIAAAAPHELELHGDVRVDNYYWLNQREDPEVLAYLEAENEYTDALMAHTNKLQKTLVGEFTERIKQVD